MFCRPLIQTPVLWLAAAGLGAAVGLGAELEAGAGSTDTPPFQVKQRWTTEQGLPQNRIACLKQTRDGYLWIGTWFGLVRFDGVHFTVFNKFNTPELVSDTVEALAEDTEGTLWVGTENGLVSYREHQFHRLTTADGLPDPIVPRLLSSRAGGLWVHSGGNILRLDAGKFSRPLWLETGINTGIRALHETPDGALQVFMQQGWWTLTPQGSMLATNYSLKPFEPEWLAALPTGQPGAYWVGTAQGVGEVVAGGLVTHATTGLSEGAVDLFFRDHRGKLWANVRSKPTGLYSLEGTHWTALDLGALPASSIVCMEQDREGNLWLGTGEGLVQLQRPAVKVYTTRDGLADDNVWTVCQSEDGMMWVGSDHGLNCIRDGRVVPVGAGEPEPGTGVYCLWPGRDGSVWLPKIYCGLLEVQGGQFSKWLEPAQMPGLIRALYQTRSGVFWIGGNGGAMAFPPGHFGAPCARATGQDLGDVHSILETRNGELWFGTKGHGLARLRDGHYTHFTDRDGLGSNDIWSIYEDPEGVLWLGTEKGLSRYGQGRFFAFAQQQGLPENTVNCVLEDERGQLWLSGLHGIHRVGRAELNAVAEGKRTKVQCFTLGTADGLESAETNGESQPAGWKARDGRLWFPTAHGLVVIDPKEVPLEEPPPPVFIERVLADEQTVLGDAWAEVHFPDSRQGVKDKQPASRDHRLAAGHGHVLEFRYTANTFTAPGQARFCYRLVGADRDWREETSERTVRYINLRPGDYRFEVSAANHHGVWNPHPASFAFSLAPYFWQTWTFYVLCGCGVIGLAALIQAYRLRWQHRLLKVEEQRTLANERARIARDLHDDLGTALTGLALELDVVGRKARPTPAVAAHLGETAQRTRELAQRMREVVWTVNPKCDTVSSLAGFLEQQVSQFLGADGLRLHLDFPEDIPPLPLGAEARHHLALNVREALTNVVRHAQATEVSLRLAVSDGTLAVYVQDNGRGFGPGQTHGQGLANMRTRMQQIGGTFECAGSPGTGTQLVFRLPLAPPAVP
jgi:signal transduction histidine kinase/ligand-binding sensor domain-containing protein